MERWVSLLGLAVFIGIAYAMSNNRQEVRWKTVLWGVALQFVFAVIVLQPSMQDFFFDSVSDVVNRLLSFGEEGAKFIFGTMQPVEVTTVDLATQERSSTVVLGDVHPAMKNIAFWIILPSILFFSALMSILYQLGIMQRIVWGIAWVMQRTMGTTGPESLSAAANIFVGQTEAPLVIKPYIHRLTTSELHAVMTGGFATVAGGVMAAYVGFLQSSVPNIAGHLVAASIMSAPAALAISKLMAPMPASHHAEESALELDLEKPYSNLVEAAAVGATEGMKLVLNVLAMLVAFFGIIMMINWGLSYVPYGDAGLSLQMLLGWLFSPLAFCMGIPWSESAIVGSLIGEKLVLTEFVAYLHLGELMSGAEPLSERSAIISSYALCGFANFASIGIQIGGISSIAEERTSELAAIGLRAMIGGTLAAMMTATVAGAIIG